MLIEGYKYEPVPKIEARRVEAAKTELLAPLDPHIIAIAADHEVADTALPVLISMIQVPLPISSRGRWDW